MIALSTTWGRHLFPDVLELARRLRDAFPALEIAWPPPSGRTLPSARALRTLAVEARILAVASKTRSALPALFHAADAALACGAPLLTLPPSEPPTEDRSRGLEDLARLLFDLGRRESRLRVLVETPAGATGLPAPDEIRELLAAAPNLGYCHVAGRAEHLRHSSPWHPEAWLEAAGDLTCAAVLDDGGTDGSGRLPGAGSVDYRRLREQLPGRALRILRPPPEADERLVRTARDEIADLGLDAPSWRPTP